MFSSSSRSSRSTPSSGSNSVGRWRPLWLLTGATLLFGGLSHAGSSPATVQSFLVRNTYLKLGPTGPQRALSYRLQHYTQIRPVQFFGRQVQLHEAVHEPLRCVERYIRQHCGDEYAPVSLSGWRGRNTFKQQSDWRQQEYSNHLFGLALDIDPDKNPCCGCVDKWATVERCKKGATSMGPDMAPIGRHEIPNCWIDAFKQHGFHWLGDDPQLRDTMHFEYLAPPGAVTCPK